MSDIRVLDWNDVTKWSDVTKGELETALTSIMTGYDPDAALNLIEYFYERISNEEQYDEQVLHAYLSHAFRKIVVEKWSADHAFGFKLKRGKYPREDTTTRDIAAVAYVVLLKREKWTLQDAKGEAANYFFPYGIGDKAVEAAYTRYKNELANLSNEILMAMLPAEIPVISRDMTGKTIS